MCELFGLTGPEEIIVNEYLGTFFRHSIDHPNGWGIAVFRGKEVNIEKEPVAAFRSGYLRERLKTPLRAGNMMAHIRFATRGQMEYENCHPFIKRDKSGRTWTFMHNGTIFNCPLINKYLYNQSGQTDSERILLYMIDQINAETDKQGRMLKDSERFDVIDRVVQLITAHNKVNFMLYDGSMFYVHENMRGTLFMCHLGRSLIFATDPLDNKKWESVEPCRLQAFKNGRRVLTGTVHQNEYIENPEDMRLIFLDYAQL
jgi:glutamine amidotransferase